MSFCQSQEAASFAIRHGTPGCTRSGRTETLATKTPGKVDLLQKHSLSKRKSLAWAFSVVFLQVEEWFLMSLMIRRLWREPKSPSPSAWSSPTTRRCFLTETLFGLKTASSMVKHPLTWFIQPFSQSSSASSSSCPLILRFLSCHVDQIWLICWCGGLKCLEGSSLWRQEPSMER